MGRLAADSARREVRVPNDLEGLQRARLYALFRERKSVGLAWGQTVASAHGVIDELKAADWTDEDIAYAITELCRAVLLLQEFSADA